MKIRNLATAKTLSSAMLSATLAGGMVAYSSVAISAERSTSQEAQSQQSQNAQFHQAKQVQQDQTQRDSANRQQNQQGPEMSQVDQNDDAELVWTEIYAIYDEELDDAGWTEDYVFDTYDQNADASLSDDEYVIFVSGLADTTDGQALSSADEQSTSDSGARDQSSAETQTDQNAQAATDLSQQSQQQNQQAVAPTQSSANAQQDAGEPAAAPATAVISVVTVTEAGLTPSQIEDREVINYNGESIGDVEQVVTLPDGTISGLVVGVGGFWGLGEKDVFVPVNEVRAAGDRIVWETFLDEDQLDDMPQYEAQEYSVIP